jgi:LPXTG-motif cell wall-anchored protein
MSVFNKRNAVLGWAVWQVSKVAAKRKVKSAAPGRSGDSMRPNKGAIAAGVAAVGGAVLFWRKRRSSDDASSDDATTS